MKQIVILPGLGKSSLAASDNRIIDLEDYLGHDVYASDEVAEAVKNVIPDLIKSGVEIVLSSKWFEDFNLKTDMFICANRDMYNGNFLDKRGRNDLTKLYDDSTLSKWVDDIVDFTSNNNVPIWQLTNKLFKFTYANIMRKLSEKSIQMSKLNDDDTFLDINEKRFITLFSYNDRMFFNGREMSNFTKDDGSKGARIHFSKHIILLQSLVDVDVNHTSTKLTEEQFQSIVDTHTSMKWAHKSYLDHFDVNNITWPTLTNGSDEQVGIDDGGTLILGKGGDGKSTLMRNSAAKLAEDGEHVGFINIGEPEPYSLPGDPTYLFYGMHQMINNDKKLIFVDSFKDFAASFEGQLDKGGIARTMGGWISSLSSELAFNKLKLVMSLNPQAVSDDALNVVKELLYSNATSLLVTFNYDLINSGTIGYSNRNSNRSFVTLTNKVSGNHDDHIANKQCLSLNQLQIKTPRMAIIHDESNSYLRNNDLKDVMIKDKHRRESTQELDDLIASLQNN